MKTFLKILAIVLIGLYFSACGTSQKRQLTREEWDVDASNPAVYQKHMADRKECEDFAFKSVIGGSRYYESDIINHCLSRKGYKTRVVVVGSQ